MFPLRRAGGADFILSVLSGCGVAAVLALAAWAVPEALAAAQPGAEWIAAAPDGATGSLAPAEISPFTLREIGLVLALVVLAGLVTLVLIDVVGSGRSGRGSRTHS
jgi:hypothetical protein